MTFLRETIETLTCDRCGRKFHTWPHTGRRAARKSARLVGWTIRWARNRTMQDWCPECSR